MADPNDYVILWYEQPVTHRELLQESPNGVSLGHFEDRLGDRALQAMARRLMPGVVMEKRQVPNGVVYRFTMAVLRSAPDLMAWTREIAAERRLGALEAADLLLAGAATVRQVGMANTDGPSERSLRRAAQMIKERYGNG